MFESYFCPRVITRLKAAPDAAPLEAFLGYLHPRGHSRALVQTYVRAAELLLLGLRRRGASLASVNESLVRHFACRGRRQRRPRAVTHAALRHFLCFLRKM